jgi:hypothetical protein
VGNRFVKKGVERGLTTKRKPIFKLMEQYPGFDTLAQDDKAFAQTSFTTATEYFKTRVSYV